MASAKQLLTHAIHKMSEEECGRILDGAHLEFLHGAQTLHWTDGSLRNDKDLRVNVGIGGITKVTFSEEDEEARYARETAKPNGLDETPEADSHKSDGSLKTAPPDTAPPALGGASI